LNGTVTAEDIYSAASATAFDVLHFATHGGPDGIALSGGAIFTAEDIAQVARLRESQGVFFNACNTGKLAAYAVRHGPRWAISSEVELLDFDAWKPAAAFYSHLRNGNSKDFVGAYLLGDSGDGDFALHIDPLYVRELQRSAAIATTLPHTATPTLTRREAMLWGVGLLVASGALTGAILAMTGGF